MEATEPWVPAFAGGSLGKLIDLARDALKNVLRPAEVELSLEERQLRDMFKRVAGEVGDRLLDAEDVRDLHHRIGQALVANELYELGATAMRAATVDELTRAPTETSTELPAELVSVLGEHPTARFISGLRLWQVAFLENLRVLMNLDERERVAGLEAAQRFAHDPVAIVYESALPLALRESLLDCMRGLPAGLAIARAVATNRGRLEPWLARELASTVERGQKGYLRYVAALEGAAVSEAILPASERLDMGRLERERQSTARQIEEWAADAEASGQEVYAPADPK